MLEHYYKLERKIQELRRSNMVEILDEMAAVYHGWRMPYVSAIARLRAAFYFGEWMRGNAILPRVCLNYSGGTSTRQKPPNKG